MISSFESFIHLDVSAAHASSCIDYINQNVHMVSTTEVDRWTEAGGTVEEKTSGKRVTKTWVAGDGALLIWNTKRSRMIEEAGSHAGMPLPSADGICCVCCAACRQALQKLEGCMRLLGRERKGERQEVC